MKKFILWDKILYFISSGYTSVYSSASSEHKQSLWQSIAYFIYRIFGYPIQLIFRKELYKINEQKILDIWLIYGSANNYNALFPILNPENSIFILPNRDIVYRRMFFYKLIWIIPLFFWLIKKNRIKYFIKYYNVLGLHEESLRILKKFRPKKLIFSNDHVPIQTALKLAATDLGIETYYFQHGAITKAFPPLNFTVSFLNGKNDLEKYSNIGIIKGRVELIGNLKARRKSLVKNTSRFVKTIGIAINRNNNIKDLLNLVKDIKHNFPRVSIIIRNHPADRRIVNILENSFAISNPVSENTFDFLSGVDLLIATNSSIHLEAVLLNVVSIYYRISEHNFLDSHGFVKNGLIDYAASLDELVAIIKAQTIKKKDVVQRAAYYDEFINSSCNYEKILLKYGLKIRPEFSNE